MLYCSLSGCSLCRDYKVLMSHILTLITLCTVFSTFDQNFDFKIRREHKKYSYERRAYESVDVRSLFWVIPHRSTETSSQGLKGLKKI